MVALDIIDSFLNRLNYFFKKNKLMTICANYNFELFKAELYTLFYSGALHFEREYSHQGIFEKHYACLNALNHVEKRYILDMINHGLQMVSTRESSTLSPMIQNMSMHSSWVVQSIPKMKSLTFPMRLYIKINLWGSVVSKDVKEIIRHNMLGPA